MERAHNAAIVDECFALGVEVVDEVIGMIPDARKQSEARGLFKNLVTATRYKVEDGVHVAGMPAKLFANLLYGSSVERVHELMTTTKSERKALAGARKAAEAKAKAKATAGKKVTPKAAPKASAPMSLKDKLAAKAAARKGK